MPPGTDIREAVRRRHAEAATRFADRSPGSCCGPAGCGDQDEAGAFGARLYADEAAEVPRAAVEASIGCGVPTAVADLHPGEVVFDLGSGAGADVLIAARRASPGGRAIALDMATEMLEPARHNAAQPGVRNVEFIEGYLEDIPLPDASVDVVLSNCCGRVGASPIWANVLPPRSSAEAHDGQCPANRESVTWCAVGLLPILTVRGTHPRALWSVKANPWAKKPASLAHEW